MTSESDSTITGGDDSALRLIPTTKAARMLGVSPRTIQRAVRSGLIPTVRMSRGSGARWVRVDALRRFVDGGGVPAAAD